MKLCDDFVVLSIELRIGQVMAGGTSKFLHRESVLHWGINNHANDVMFLYLLLLKISVLILMLLKKKDLHGVKS